MLPIRLRLPLTYAGIALLTALALSILLLLTVQRYYQEQETRFLHGNARQIGRILTREGMPVTAGLPTQIKALAFLAQVPRAAI